MRIRYSNPVDRIINKIEPQGDCWIWKGIISYKGYGLINVNQQKRKAHRYSYTHFINKIPDGMTIDHLCRVRACVNPDHLEVVTLVENIRRGLIFRQPKKQCNYGHPLIDNNLYINYRGHRSCLKCNRKRSREYMRKRRLQNA